MQETLVDTTLIKFGEGILGETMVTNTKDAAEVAKQTSKRDKKRSFYYQKFHTKL